MNDDHFLKRAFEIAGKVDPHAVAPNPRVGCVVTTDQRNNGSTEQCIISEGVHEVFGGPHAEVSAFGSVSSEQLAMSNNLVAYLTLEPCDHFAGKKTGSCTDLLIAAKPKRVVIGALDPKFGGKSVERLREAGIETIFNDQYSIFNERLNPFFSHYQTTGKPWMTLKVAQSLDGRITLNASNANNASNASKERLRYITNEQSRKEVHRMRAQYSAILTTTETVLQDDPALNCRGGGSDPKVIILGKREIPKESRIWNLESRREIVQFETLDEFLKSEMYSRLDSIMTECGSTLNATLLQEGLVDEIRMFFAPKVFGEGKLAFETPQHAAVLQDFELKSVRELGGDLEMRYIRERILDKPE